MVTTGSKSKQRTNPVRRLHLGVDYGTSWSKLIFRDYQARGGEKSFVIRVPGETRGSLDYRIPSLVTLLEGRFWFGWRAVEMAEKPNALAYTSIKVRAALPEHFFAEATPLPEGFSADDLAALSVLYLLTIGDYFGSQYVRNDKHELALSMTLGVPMSHLDNPALKAQFVRLAQIAYQVYRAHGPIDFSKGIVVSRARELLNEAVTELETSGRFENVDHIRWVRPEFVAALFWAFHSPRIVPGLYAAIDVGAGTTSASFFRITAGTRNAVSGNKEGMAFFGASCRPPGADAVGQLIAMREKMTLRQVRGIENELIEKHRIELDHLLSKYFEPYRVAFGRGYEKHKAQSAWQDYGLFLLGGGTEILPIAKHLRVKTPWTKLEKLPVPSDPGIPTDLLDLGTGRRISVGIAKYLLVAYGLSHFAEDIPEVQSPSDIPQFVRKPPREIEMDLDAWYPK